MVRNVRKIRAVRLWSQRQGEFQGMCHWECQIQHRKGHIKCNADIIVSLSMQVEVRWCDKSEFTGLKSEWEMKNGDND